MRHVKYEFLSLNFICLWSPCHGKTKPCQVKNNKRDLANQDYLCRDCHTKWSKSDRERQISYDVTYMWNIEYDTNELFIKQKHIHRLRKQIYFYQRGKEKGIN